MCLFFLVCFFVLAGTEDGVFSRRAGSGHDLDAGERVREEHRRGAGHLLPPFRGLPGQIFSQLR